MKPNDDADRWETLAVQLEISRLLAEFWHDVDNNWGASAHQYFTTDAVFTTSIGRTRQGLEAIREFYDSRQARGPRVARHLVSNLRVERRSTDEAIAHWILVLYANDGEPVLPSEPPIMVADVVDECRRQPDGSWKFASRTITALFKGERPTTG